ncbi:MAG TPA: glutathione S-transferase N-terminal domain-containing protein [Solirubrobacteraceae bacterium]|nr:glutathione S-transferase N-terminal domain-containing protein [Solirubrobacteraceae bacterium]
MRVTLYVVHGSHPCAAVEKALAIKGLRYRVIEWPPPMQVPMQTVIFGGRTVPGLRIDGEKILGSRVIMRRLDELVPDPPLLPADPERRSRVLGAEQWGDEVFQPIARELIWAGFVHRPDAMVSYNEHSRLHVPGPAVRLIGPVIARLGRGLNKTSDAVARTDLTALPAHLDTVDGWIADGTIGDADRPNAADLQILSTVRLMLTFGDARPLIEGRPCATAARAVFPDADGELPAGAIAA